MALPDDHLVARGAMQAVYAYPGRPDLVIKVVRPDFVSSRWTGWKGWLRRRRRLGPRTGWLRAMTEYMALVSDNLAPNAYVQDVIGFVRTDIGPGMVTRAVRGRDGGFAPTLMQLIQRGGYSPAVAERLDEFCAWLAGAPVCVGDLHPGNLLLGRDERWGERLVLVDGLGDKTLIPLSAWSPRVRRMQRERKIARLRAVVARRVAAHAQAPTAAAVALPT